MNTQFLSLTSTNTNQTTTTQTVGMVDHTILTISLSGVTERFLPTHVIIDWGDNFEDVFENDILKTQNIASDIFSSVFNDTYSHEYFPSPTSTSQTLTSTVSIYYTNSDRSTFTLPLSITNYDYENSIGDVLLVNTDFLQNGKKIHQLVTDKGGYLLELYCNNQIFCGDIEYPDIIISGTLTPDATGTYSFSELNTDGTPIWLINSGTATIYWSLVDSRWEILYPTSPGFVTWVSDATTLVATPLPTDATNWVPGLAVVHPVATGTPTLSLS